MNKKRKQWMIIGIVVLVFLVIVGLAVYYFMQPQTKLLQKEGEVAGQKIIVSGSGDGLDLAFSKTQQELESFYSAIHSETKNIEDLSGVQAVSCSDMTFDFLKEMAACSEQFQGLFDGTAGSVYQQWGLLSGKPVLPDSEKLNQALKTVGYQQLQFDPEKKTVKLGNLGAKFYFPQFLYGKIADLGAASLGQFGASSGMISVGGAAAVTGKKPDHSPYYIAVQDGEKLTGKIKLETGGIEILYFQKNTFTLDGKTYSNILNPKTGQPVDPHLEMIAVKADTAAEASCLSLYLAIEGRDYLKEHLNDYAVLCIDADGKLLISRQMKRIFQKG